MTPGNRRVREVWNTKARALCAEQPMCAGRLNEAGDSGGPAVFPESRRRVADNNNSFGGHADAGIKARLLTTATRGGAPHLDTALLSLLQRGAGRRK